MRFFRHRALVVGLALVASACSQEMAEEKARAAAEEAQEAIKPIDDGATEQDVDAETIKKVQQQLTSLKEYMGPITGELDTVTINALEAFQRKQDITPDGRFNPETLQALDAAAPAKS
ncbi:MAG: peptidoglycan-binding protein [Deltaproteobacteria bacterium]|nr:peptidoglycan-binding protein [Deltaproteobacteria bacterium]